MPAVLSPSKSRTHRSQITVKPHKESRLLLLPAELLSDILKFLSWRDVMRVRLTCTHLRKLSKTAWRSIACRESRHTWWLEQPVDAHSEDELEFLYLRRQSAEIGYTMMANGAAPRQRTGFIPNLSNCFRLLPGGRWLLTATDTGSVLYFDLDIPEVIAKVLIAGKSSRCATFITLDLDTTSPTLMFNLALSKQNAYTTMPQEPLEVWQVNIVTEKTGRGINLQAVCLKSFFVEPPGWVHSLSLLGGSLAYSHAGSDQLVTAVVSWTSIEAPNYSKRIFFPAHAECTHLLPGDLLLSLCEDGACVLPLSSLPEVKAIHSFDDIERIVAAPIAAFGYPMHHAVSNSTFHEGSARLVMYSDEALRGLVVEYNNPESKPNPGIQVVKLADVSEDFDSQISVSEDFILAWDENGGLVLRHVAWSDNQIVRIASVCLDQSVPFCSLAEYACVLDMTSGRIVVQQLAGKFTVLDFAFLELQKVS
ncbi:hypothetical protein BDN72DRAFT_848855, partial [Pluteus cervinus]